MNIIIKTKNLELTDSLKIYINKRISGLVKFIKEVPDIFVDIHKETNHHKKGDIFKAEVTIHLPKKTLIATMTGSDLGKTVTYVRDELKRKIQDHKLKSIELGRRQAKKNRKEIRAL